MSHERLAAKRRPPVGVSPTWGRRGRGRGGCHRPVVIVAAGKVRASLGRQWDSGAHPFSRSISHMPATGAGRHLALGRHWQPLSEALSLGQRDEKRPSGGRVARDSGDSRRALLHEGRGLCECGSTGSCRPASNSSAALRAPTGGPAACGGHRARHGAQVACGGWPSGQSAKAAAAAAV